jgi:hypothetical protein
MQVNSLFVPKGQKREYMSTVANPVVSSVNPLQLAAIASLIAAYLQYRQLAVITETVPNADAQRDAVSNWTINPNSVCFRLLVASPDGTSTPLPNSPVIECKRTGRFALPSIRSYREGNVPNTYVYPGATAFDAALFADMHVLKQNGAYRRAPQSVLAPNVGGMAATVQGQNPQGQAPAPAPDAFAMVPANVGQTEPAPTVSAETGQDTAKLTEEIQGKGKDKGKR